MPNTYTQIHIHAVFAVRKRAGLIQKSWKDERYKYIAGILKNKGHKPLAINGMPDHIHIFFGMRPEQSLSSLMQEVKANASRWVNESKLTKEAFEWQTGYGAFSYTKSQIGMVVNYIEQQERHHARQTFIEEYKGILQKFEIDYDERYLFKDPE